MTPLRAYWHWTGPVERAIELAKETSGNAVITKAAYQEPLYSTNLVRRVDYPGNARKIKDAGLLVGAEIYNSPGAWEAEGDCLRDALNADADFAVLNMEGPYEAETTEHNARALITRIATQGPVWVCSDFRRGRLLLPYVRAVAPFVTGWMPMIYPGAFYPDTPFGDLQRAFDDAYWSWIANNSALPLHGAQVPILPAIQSYDGMDYEEMVGQIVLAWRWTKVLNKTTHGSSVYVAHDVNARAKWGIRDGWEVVEDAVAEHQVSDWKVFAEAAAYASSIAASEAASKAAGPAAGKAAYDAVRKLGQQ